MIRAAQRSLARGWSLAVAFSLTLVLAACTPPEAPPLRLVASSWPGYETLYLARELGHFDESKVVCLELPDSSLSFQAFRNDSVDLAAMSLNQYLELVRGGTHARIIAVLDRSAGGDAAMASAAVRDLHDLKGKRILLPNFSMVGNQLLSHMLAEAHLERKDVHIMIDAQDRHEKLFRNGGADVVMSYEPYKSGLAAAGAHDIYDTNAIPNEVIDVLAVRENIYQQRREDVCALLRQWFATQRYVDEHPKDAYTLMARRLHKSPAEFEVMLKGMALTGAQDNLNLLHGAKPAILDTMQSLNTLLVGEKAWAAPLDLRPSLAPETRACIG